MLRACKSWSLEATWLRNAPPSSWDSTFVFTVEMHCEIIILEERNGGRAKREEISPITCYQDLLDDKVCMKMVVSAGSTVFGHMLTEKTNYTYCFIIARRSGIKFRKEKKIIE
jgi:hypothetical protein